MKNLKPASALAVTVAGLVLSVSAFAATNIAYNDVVAAARVANKSEAAKCKEVSGGETADGEKTIRCRRRIDEPRCAAARQSPSPGCFPDRLIAGAKPTAGTLIGRILR